MTGTVVTQGTISIGTVVAQVGTVAVSTVTSVVALGTIQNAPMVTVQGTVTAAIAATLEVGTIVVGVEGSVVVATILNSPMVTVQGTVTTGDMGTVVVSGVLGGTLALGGGSVAVQQLYFGTNILTGGTVASGTTQSTLVAQRYQDVIVDTFYGTAYPTAGSVQAMVTGLEPQSKQVTSTLVTGSWFAGTVPSGQRIAVTGPTGGFVVVKVIVVGGTVGPVYVTAQQSTTN